MKIYTKTGDRGETGLFGGARVSKASARVAAYGDVDELNSQLGVVCTQLTASSARLSQLRQIQADLFSLGAELARDPSKQVDLGVPLLSDAEIERLERAIDELDRGLPALKTFVLPGGSLAAAFLHVARTICRRAERAVVQLGQSEDVRGELVRYLNRLSDFLFTLARAENHAGGVPDVPWMGRRSEE
jgi:cob(I)alamin adenosyltransferase